MSNIITQQNYLAPSRFISGRIVEYDIKSANISCLRQADVITEEDYQYLYNLPKMQREIEIGLRIKRDPKLYTVIKTKIKEAKEYLYKANNLVDDHIVRVANDAVYINSQFDCMNLQYGDYIRFVPKSVSNIFVSLDKILLMIGYLEDGNISVDIKGINPDYLGPSYNYLISELTSVCLIKERSGVKDALNYLTNFIEVYLRLELDINYYRDLNTGKFKIKNFSLPGGGEKQDKSKFFDILLDNINEWDKGYVDINYNYFILRELFSILIEIYNIQQ